MFERVTPRKGSRTISRRTAKPPLSGVSSLVSLGIGGVSKGLAAVGVSARVGTFSRVYASVTTQGLGVSVAFAAVLEMTLVFTQASVLLEVTREVEASGEGFLTAREVALVLLAFGMAGGRDGGRGWFRLRLMMRGSWSRRRRKG